MWLIFMLLYFVMESGVMICCISIKDSVGDPTMWTNVGSGSVTFALLRGVGLRDVRAVGVVHDELTLLPLPLFGAENKKAFGSRSSGGERQCAAYDELLAAKGCASEAGPTRC